MERSEHAGPDRFHVWHHVLTRAFKEQHWGDRFERGQTDPAYEQQQVELLVAMCGWLVCQPDPEGRLTTLERVMLATLTKEDLSGVLQAVGFKGDLYNLYQSSTARSATQALEQFLHDIDERMAREGMPVDVPTEDLVGALNGWIAEAGPEYQGMVAFTYGQLGREAPGAQREAEEETVQLARDVGDVAIVAARVGETAAQEINANLPFNAAYLLGAMAPSSTTASAEVTRLRRDRRNPEAALAFVEWLERLLEAEFGDSPPVGWRESLALAKTERSNSAIDRILAERGFSRTPERAKNIRVEFRNWLHAWAQRQELASRPTPEQLAQLGYAELTQRLLSLHGGLQPVEERAVMLHMTSTEPLRIRQDALARGLSHLRDLHENFFQMLRQTEPSKWQILWYAPANRVWNALMGDPSTSRRPITFATVLGQVPEEGREKVEPAMRMLLAEILAFNEPRMRGGHIP